MERISRVLIQALDWYDAHIERQKAVPCSGDILCQRSGKRHQDGCIGRVEPFNIYVKGIRSVR